MTSPHFILSVTKKYRTSRCLHLLLDPLPFSDSSMVLLLSWYIVVTSIGSPCAAKKCLVHSIRPIASSIATSCASVELLVFNFYLHDDVYTPPFPMDIKIPVWLFISGCTAYELSTHHCGLLVGSIVSVIAVVPLRYCMTLVSFL